MSITNIRLLVISLLVLLGVGSAGAWEPPLGIPRPQFGIEEVAPTATRVISGSLPSSLTLSPGSVVEIAAGNYSGSLTIQGSCTRENPCFVRGSGPDRMPKLSGKFAARNASYVVLEYLDFDGGICGALGIGGASNHLAIRHSVFQNRQHPGSLGCSGIGIVPDLGRTISDVVIYRNRFVRLGMNEQNWPTLDEDFHAINPNLWNRDASTEQRNIWIVDNYCEALSGNCVQVNGGTWTDSHLYLHHVYIGRNVHCCSRQSGFWVKQASHVIISENVAYGGRAYKGGAGDGIGYQYGPDNLWIIFNRLYDNNFGIRQSDTPSSSWDRKIYIVGNVIYNSSQQGVTHWSSPDGWAISLWHGNSTRYLVDNTIYNVHNGMEFILDGPVTLSGNIVSDLKPPCAGCPPGYHLSVSQPARNGHASIDHSILHEPLGGEPWRALWWDRGTFSSLAAFQTATGQCANCKDLDPLFVNAVVNDLRLRLVSPARDAGLQDPVYAIFEGLYGLSIARDAARTVRPQDGLWDIGAYEYSSSGGASPLAPPHGLTVR